MDAVQDDNKTVIIIEECERERFRNTLRKVLEREKSYVKFDAVEAATIQSVVDGARETASSRGDSLDRWIQL